MFCALLMSRYQVSVYRTNGPLVCSFHAYTYCPCENISWSISMKEICPTRESNLQTPLGWTWEQLLTDIRQLIGRRFQVQERKNPAHLQTN